MWINMKKPNRYYSVMIVDKLNGTNKTVLTRAYSITEAILRACNARGLSVNKVYQVAASQISEEIFKAARYDVI